MPDTKWIATDGYGLVWHAWSSDQVVYHRGSGDTHLLDTASSAMLRCITSRPLSVQELVAEVAAAVGVSPDDDFQIQVRRALIRFHNLGLAETLTP